MKLGSRPLRLSSSLRRIAVTNRADEFIRGVRRTASLPLPLLGAGERKKIPRERIGYGRPSQMSRANALLARSTAFPANSSDCERSRYRSSTFLPSSMLSPSDVPPLSKNSNFARLFSKKIHGNIVEGARLLIYAGNV